MSPKRPRGLMDPSRSGPDVENMLVFPAMVEASRWVEQEEPASVSVSEARELRAAVASTEGKCHKDLCFHDKV